MYADMEAKVGGLNKKIAKLEADLAACKKARAALDGEVSLANGRVREMQSERDAAKAAAAKSAKGSDNSALVANLNSKVSGLEADLATCQKAKADLSSQVADANAKVKDMKGQVDAAKAASLTQNVSAGTGIASGLAATSTPEPTPAPAPQPAAAPAKDIYAVIKQDDLQIIEGIGPKMEAMLKENGISSHSVLASKSTADIQAILGKYGDRYKIIDPGTWVQQAGLAAGKNWEDLIDLQKKLDAGKDTNIDLTDSKLEKKLIKLGAIVRHKQDDLKAVEGIGPAIERLMHEAGIKTWRDMANSSVERLQSILEAAGSRFKLADPGTWPKQAEMAADGKFKELQEYQDFLQGGR